MAMTMRDGNPARQSIKLARSRPEALAVYQIIVPLVVPYRLSFAELRHFDVFVVRLEIGGWTGLGEITPLPGYSEETPDTVVRTLRAAGRALQDGKDISDFINHAFETQPFAASGLRCALETATEEGSNALHRSVGVPVPIAALCPGDDPEAAAEAAIRLTGEGYRCLKLKVAADAVDRDIVRLQAVAAVAPGIEIRADANQRLPHAAALAFCEAFAAIPNATLEQPFAPDDWDATEALIATTGVAVTLDESIRNAADIERAALIGARRVKLKLCKQDGIAGTHALAEDAARRGLGVLIGNGVQSALGNQLEAWLHQTLRLTLPAECNGFLKIADFPLRHHLSVRDGALHAGGLIAPLDDLAALEADPDLTFIL